MTARQKKLVAFIALMVFGAGVAVCVAMREAVFGPAGSAAGIEALMGAPGLAAAAISTGLMVLHSFVPLPAELIAIANGMVFGFAVGLAITWASAMLGAGLAYGIGWKFGRPAAIALTSEAAMARAEALLRRYGAPGLIAARLLPVISFNLVNYAAGALHVRPWPFLWTTALGILPVCAVSVLAGSHMIKLPWHVNALIFTGLALLAAGAKVVHARRGRAAGP